MSIVEKQRAIAITYKRNRLNNSNQVMMMKTEEQRKFISFLGLAELQEATSVRAAANIIVLLVKFSTQIPESISSSLRLTGRYC